MVRASVRRSSIYVARKQTQSYSSGAVCYVLSKQDCSSLVQFYALLLKIDRRMANASKAPFNKKGPRHSLIQQPKMKGSQTSGPCLLFHAYNLKIFQMVHCFYHKNLFHHLMHHNNHVDLLLNKHLFLSIVH